MSWLALTVTFSAEASDRRSGLRTISLNSRATRVLE